MDNTVAAVLTALNLDEYTHVCVRYKDPNSRDWGYVGGGYAPSVIRRFGHLVIHHSYLLEKRLLIFVVL